MLRDNSQGRQPDDAGIERSRRGFKEQLSQKIAITLAKSRSLADNMGTKDYHQGKQTCSECGTTFHGKGNADTCSVACRVAKSRS